MTDLASGAVGAKIREMLRAQCNDASAIRSCCTLPVQAGFWGLEMVKNIRTFAITGVVAALALAGSTAAWAQAASTESRVVDVGSGVVDAETIKEGLFPLEHCEELRKNGFKCMGVKPTVTFSLPAVAFAFGSAVLPQSLMRQLDVFAEVLSANRTLPYTIRIVGHADASGTEEGNRVLSQRRAEEVRRYLVSKGADGGKLDVAGVGSKDLLKPDTPTSADNRRVTLGR